MQWIVGATVNLQRRQCAGGAAAADLAVVGDDLDAREGFHRAEELILRQEQIERRQQWTIAIPLHHLEAGMAVAPEILDRSLYIAMQTDHNRLEQIVNDHHDMLEEQRQIKRI